MTNTPKKRSNVEELRLDSLSRAKNRLSIYNPMFDVFEIEYEDKKYSLEPQTITKFDFVIGNHIKKHLRDWIINKRGYTGSIYTEREKVEKEISV